MKLFTGDTPSGKYQLDTKSLGKIGRGALVALGGALLTYLAEVVLQIDFGQFTPIVVALSGIAINAGRKFLEDFSTEA